jgi:uncharacterized SAM-binding protein YcdF (DUF218 family)
MSVRVKQAIAYAVAALLAAIGIVFPIWIAATVGDPRVGNPASTMIYAGFVAFVVVLVGRRMWRDRNG